MNIKGINFIDFISEKSIQAKLDVLAAEVTRDYADRVPVFIPILNGSFMFAADLLKRIGFACEVSFVKVASYEGLSSSGNLRTLVGLDQSLTGRDVLIVEDVVDTGLTLARVESEIRASGARSVEVIALLRKKPARERGIHVRFTGFDIDDEFVLGYGLDFDGQGRNFPALLKADAKV